MRISDWSSDVCSSDLILPALRLVRTLAIGIGGQRLIDDPGGQLEAGTVLRFREGQAVHADLDFDDVRDAVLPAILEFRLLHAARGVGDVGVLRPHALAKQLHAPAGAGDRKSTRLNSS